MSPNTKPPVWETVLLLHYYEDAEDDPLCESGYLNADGEWVWHNAFHNMDEVEVHAWLPLPLLPERGAL